MNESGITPMEFKVLIKPETVQEKSHGGIIIPDSAKEKAKFATMRGNLIAAGAIAFTDPNWLETPKIGEMVLFDRYAGGLVSGADGVEYRLINDKEIQAVVNLSEV